MGGGGERRPRDREQGAIKSRRRGYQLNNLCTLAVSLRDGRTNGEPGGGGDQPVEAPD